MRILILILFTLVLIPFAVAQADKKSKHSSELDLLKKNLFKSKLNIDHHRSAQSLDEIDLEAKYFDSINTKASSLKQLKEKMISK